jgi:hypothetical protein
LNTIKAIITEFLTRTKRILNEKRAEMKVSDFPPFKVVEVVIGSTTYLVSSFFKKDAKGNAVDKVRRLIEREAENAPEK